MAKNGRNLGAVRERGLLALLSARTIQDASEASKIPYRTLWRWLQQEDFAAEYRRRMDSLVDEACGQLKQSLSGAVDVLREIAEDGQAPPGARISAARTLLESGLRYVEMTEVLRRMEEIEDAVKEYQKPSR